MISLDEAFRIVMERTPRLSAEVVALDDALGRALAEDVRADTDSPAFDRSAMDGFALRAADAASPPVTLKVVDEVPAGVPSGRRIGPGECARIMTGGLVPDGADAVVMIEDTEAASGATVRALKAPKPGSHIRFRGEDFHAGDTLLQSGRTLRPADIALLAAVGCVRPRVFRAPSAAVLSTGTEIVPPDQAPGAGQVRDCNAHALIARLAREGVAARGLGIVADDAAAIRSAASKGLEHDLFIVSGGVSLGDYDLVPGVLKDLGVEIFFDKVAVKPGKPAVFGRRGNAIVFGLPGNPVSGQVIAELLMVPAVRRMAGHADVAPVAVRARLSGRIKHKGDRRTYVPVALRRGKDEWTAEETRFLGSGDVAGLARADGLAVLAEGAGSAEAGSMVDVVLMNRGAFL